MRTALSVCLAVFVTLPAVAADPSPSGTEEKAMQEHHQKMAELHRQVADCLKTGKTLEECHAQARPDCPMAGRPDCPFHGQKGRMRAGRRGAGRPARQTPPAKSGSGAQ